MYLIGNEFFDIVQRKHLAGRQQKAFNVVFERGNCVIVLARDIESIQRSTHLHKFSFSLAMARSERELMKGKRQVNELHKCNQGT